MLVKADDLEPVAPETVFAHAQRTHIVIRKTRTHDGAVHITSNAEHEHDD